MALIAAACGSSKPKATSTSTTTAAGASSGAVKYDTSATQTFFTDQEPATWNCTSADGNEFACINIVDRIWPSVFHTYPDFTNHLDTTFMVSATQTSTSPQTIVYKINPKAVWSDGTPITYQDFVYNWQAQSGNATPTDVGGKAFAPATSSGYNQIQSVAETNGDPYTVTVIFSKPYADWQGLFGADDPIVPAHIAQTVGYNDGFTDPVKDLVSGGPFMVQSYSKGTSITLVRNPKYWGAPANLAQVNFRFLTDSSQVVPALQNGEVNAGYPTPQLDLVTALKQLTSVKVDQRAGLEFEHLDFNQSNTWLKDPAIRQAIMLAIDRPQLIAATVGQFDSALTPLNDRMFVTNQPGYQDNSGGAFDHADVAKAKSVLTAAGYTLGSDGTLSKGGQKVTMRITSTQGNALRSSEEQFVINAIKAVGITATETDTSDLGGTLSGGNFDMIIFAWVSTPFPSGNDPLYANPKGAGNSNFDNTDVPAVDALITQADNTLDNTQRIAIYNQIDKVLWQNYTTYPLFQRPSLLVYQTKYLNMQNNASAEGPTYNMEDWGVKAAS